MDPQDPQTPVAETVPEAIPEANNAPEYAFAPAEKLELTEKCHHYEHKSEVPWDIAKYFAQRYSIFSWYDEGVYMTDDAWFGVTPEPVANRVADDMANIDSKKRVLIDMFAGAGGNSIAFALSERWDQIIAIELDAATLACAQNNAECYQIEPGHITWVNGDSFAYVDTLLKNPESLHPDLRVDVATSVVFASPPWGGPGYSTDAIFDLYTMQPYGLKELTGAYERFEHALFLPRTSDIRQIAKLAPEGEKIEVVQYCMEGASKAMVAYIPAKEKTVAVADVPMVNGDG